MTSQEPCELADPEVTLGLADERLWERALSEAKGVAAHARQIYWHLRAKSLQAEAQRTSSEAPMFELKALLDRQEETMRSRKERNRWLWAVACFGAVGGAFVFPRLALAAQPRGGSSFHVFAALGAASLVLLVIAHTASRYHTPTE